MEIEKIITIGVGLFAVGFTYWYFLMKKDDTAVKVSGEVDISVNGGYSPSVISVPVGQTTKLNFFRKDPSPCLEEVVLSDFKIRKLLPLNLKTTIEIKPEKSGEYSIVCGMNMFHGKIIAK